MNSALMHSICHFLFNYPTNTENILTLELRSLKQTPLARIERNLKLITWEIGYARSIFVQFASRAKDGKFPGSRSL